MDQFLTDKMKIFVKRYGTLDGDYAFSYSTLMFLKAYC